MDLFNLDAIKMEMTFRELLGISRCLSIYLLKELINFLYKKYLKAT